MPVSLGLLIKYPVVNNYDNRIILCLSAILSTHQIKNKLIYLSQFKFSNKN